MNSPKRTEDFEGVRCTCGEYMKCIDHPEYPENADVWYCKKENKYWYGV